MAKVPRKCVDRIRRSGLNRKTYELHINFPGGTPIDGPSAGIAMATAIASAIKGEPVDNKLAMTGEVGIHGNIKPVGGVLAKVEAAFQAGAETVIIPRETGRLFADLKGLEVIPVDHVEEVFRSICHRGISYFGAGTSPAADVFIAKGLPYLQADSIE